MNELKKNCFIFSFIILQNVLEFIENLNTCAIKIFIYSKKYTFMNIQYEKQINIVDESFYLPKKIKLYKILLK